MGIMGRAPWTFVAVLTACAAFYYTTTTAHDETDMESFSRLHRRQAATDTSRMDPNSPLCQSSSWPFMQVITYHSPPFVFITDLGDGSPLEYTGYSIEMLSDLSSTLNFCYNLTSLPGVRGVGATDLVVNHSSPINMAISSVTITAARYARDVDITEPYYNTGLRILVKQDNASPDWFQFLYPFSWGLWGFVLLSLVAFAFVFYLFEKRENEVEFSYKWPHQNLGLGMYASTEYMFMLGTMRPVTPAARILLIGYLLLILALTSGYTAQLTSYLTLKQFNTVFTDVDLNGYIDQNDLMSQSSLVCIPAKSAVEDYFLREVSSKYMPAANMTDCITAVGNGSAQGAVFDMPYLEWVVNQNPSEFSVIGRTFNRQGYGILVDSRIPNLTLQLSIATMNLQQSGELSRLSKLWVNSVPNPTTGANGAKQLSPSSFIGLYVILLGFLLLAWAIFLIQEYKYAVLDLLLMVLLCLEILYEISVSAISSKPVSLGFPTFNTKSWTAFKHSEVSREDRQKLLQDLVENGRLPNKSLYERLVLQTLLELLLGEKPDTTADENKQSSTSMSRIKRLLSSDRTQSKGSHGLGDQESNSEKWSSNGDSGTQMDQKDAALGEGENGAKEPLSDPSVSSDDGIM